MGKSDPDNRMYIGAAPHDASIIIRGPTTNRATGIRHTLILRSDGSTFKVEVPPEHHWMKQRRSTKPWIREVDPPSLHGHRAWEAARLAIERGETLPSLAQRIRRSDRTRHTASSTDRSELSA